MFNKVKKYKCAILRQAQDDLLLSVPIKMEL